MPPPLPRLLVFNKSDLLPPDHPHHLAMRHGGLAISAHDPDAMVRLRERIARALEAALPQPQAPEPHWDEQPVPA